MQKPRQFTHGATTYVLASPWRRLVAQIIDVLAASLIVAVCALPLLLISHALGVILAPLAYAYLLFADAIWNGQSLGKKVMKIVVMDEQNLVPCSYLQSFVRNLMKLFLLFIDWVFIFFDSQKRIGDMAASTIVVNQIPVGNNAPSKATPPTRRIDTNSEVYQTLHGVPASADYAVDATDLDLEDIPKERIEKVNALLNSADESVQYEAAKLLVNWGFQHALPHLAVFIDEPKGGFIDHQLHGFDNTQKHNLAALTRYWAIQSDEGNGQQARKDIYPLISKIIALSNTQPFQIAGMFWLVKEHGMTEYLPALRAHLASIIDHPDDYYWKICDVVTLLHAVDAEFLNEFLGQKNIALDQYLISEKGDKSGPDI
ncbi:RDD family protein [Pseudomonas quasicaspiana]|nr:RDD family protein [Pseudomonas quasicaspiana]